jgi:hypothetical protein
MKQPIIFPTTPHFVISKKTLNFVTEIMNRFLQFTKIKWSCCLAALFVLSLPSANSQIIITQTPLVHPKGFQMGTSQTPLYDSAYIEIANMLDGKQPLSIKRAVFLAEWAYLDGKLDYKKYCRTIDSAANFIKRFIKANGMEKYKTAKNLALTEYFFRPYSGNGYKSFTYNFVDTGFSTQFVTKVIETHTGQCRSLPMYYRVLAEAVDAEAYLAYAPTHVFIRYRDYDHLYSDDWVNVEATAQQLVPDFGYEERYQITDKMIGNKIYLHPLTAKETVASQLADLAMGYYRKYKGYDGFTWLCVSKSLEYYPQNPKALIIQGNSLHAILMGYLENNGHRVDEFVSYLGYELDRITTQLDEMGWEEMSEELQEELERDRKEAKQRIENSNKQ